MATHVTVGSGRYIAHRPRNREATPKQGTPRHLPIMEFRSADLPEGARARAPKGPGQPRAVATRWPRRPPPGRDAKNPGRRGQKLRKSVVFFGGLRRKHADAKTHLQETPGRGVARLERYARSGRNRRKITDFRNFCPQRRENLASSNKYCVHHRCVESERPFATKKTRLKRRVSSSSGAP